MKAQEIISEKTMSKITSCSIGHPEEEKPGLWSVRVNVNEKEHKLHFLVDGMTVQSFFENPGLQALLPSDKSAIFNLPDIVGRAYRILQDHIAQDGAPANSFAYRLASGIVQKKFEEAAAT